MALSSIKKITTKIFKNDIHERVVSMSFGVTSLQLLTKKECYLTFMQSADVALLKAKDSGKNIIITIKDLEQSGNIESGNQEDNS